MPDVPCWSSAGQSRHVPGRLDLWDRIDLVEDRHMQNVVSLEPDRPRPRRILGVPRSGARILFFTGVRYCRDDETESQPTGTGYCTAAHMAPSELMLDAATH